MHSRRERELARNTQVNHDPRSGRELSAEHFSRQRVFEVVLDRAFQRPSAILGVPALLAQKVLRARRHFEAQISASQARPEPVQLDIDNSSNLRGVEPAEHDHLVEPVQKLRAERSPHLVENGPPPKLPPRLGVEILALLDRLHLRPIRDCS